MSEVTVADMPYTYFERSFGKNRGIQISAPGLPAVTYQLRPNPHDDRDYNKNQPQFYRDLATGIAIAAQTGGGPFPPDGTVVTVFNVDYTIERR